MQTSQRYRIIARSKGVCVLVSLDLSAAFDTIDHQILLARLKHHFGITGKCLQWISRISWEGN